MSRSKFELASAVPEFTLCLDGVDYAIRFTLPIVEACELATGISLKTAEEWWDMPLKHVPTVLVVAIQKAQPDLPIDALKEILSSFPIETLYQLRYELVKTNFPIIIAKYEEGLAKKVIAAGDSPNA